MSDGDQKCFLEKPLAVSTAVPARSLRCVTRRLAGAAGFEPANAGTKNRCLTTWRRPSRRAPCRGKAGLIAARTAKGRPVAARRSPIGRKAVRARRRARLALHGKICSNHCLIRGIDDELPHFVGRHAAALVGRLGARRADLSAVGIRPERDRPLGQAGRRLLPICQRLLSRPLDHSRRPPERVAPARDDRPDGSAGSTSCSSKRRATSPSSPPTSQGKAGAFYYSFMDEADGRPARRRRHRARARRHPRRIERLRSRAADGPERL